MDEQIWLPQINLALCTGCGECIRLCPTNVFDHNKGKPFILNPTECNYCGVCEEICPVAAIELPYLITKAEDNRSDEE